MWRKIMKWSALVAGGVVAGVIWARYGWEAYLLSVAWRALVAAFVFADDKDTAGEVVAELTGQLNDMELQLACAKAYMLYMSEEVSDPCRLCKHQGPDGQRLRACEPKTDSCAWEWRGIPKELYSVKEEE
jgi:hypothetical protein